MDTGIITGVDTRECACCGGWFIDINDSLWLFNELPASSSLDLVNETFPIEVEVEWQKKVNPCLSEEILISYIKKK